MESYRTGYDLTLTANHQAKNFYEITLKAQTSQQPVERVVLLLNKKTLHPIRIKAKQQGAPGMAEVIVTEYKTKQPYTNDFFQFNPRYTRNLIRRSMLKNNTFCLIMNVIQFLTR